MGFIYQPQNLKTLVYVKNKNYLKEGKKIKHSISKICQLGPKNHRKIGYEPL